MVLFKLIHYLAVMKRNFSILVTLLLCCACTNRHDTAAKIIAQANAQNWISVNLRNINGYQPLLFTHPEPIILSYQNDLYYKRLDDSIMQVEALRFQEMGENFRLYRQRETNGFYAQKQKVFRNEQQRIAKKVKPRLVGYKIAHEFMTRDTLGWQKQEKLVLCFDVHGKLQEVMR